MPLSRTDLIARGLAQANSTSASNIPLTAMLENQHFHLLSPEEKVEIVQKYADLTSGNTKEIGSVIDYAKGGAINALLYSLPLALAAGVFTAPPMKVIKNIKSMRALRNVAERIVTPIALTSGLAATFGGIQGLVKRTEDQATNRYLHAALSRVREEEDPDMKAVNSASILAMNPEINRNRIEAGYSPTSQFAANAMGPWINQERHQEVGPRFTATITNGTNPPEDHVVHYNDWSHVLGIPSHKLR